MPLEKNSPFFKSCITPASFSNVRTCSTCSMVSSGVPNNITISSKPINAICYFTLVSRTSITFWNVPAACFSPKGICVKVNMMWWEANAVLVQSCSTIWTCQNIWFLRLMSKISSPHPATWYISPWAVSGKNPISSQRSDFSSRLESKVYHPYLTKTGSVTRIESGLVW